MISRISQLFLYPLCLLTFALNASKVEAQTTEIQPQPLYHQCETLAERGASDDVVSNSINLLKDKEPQVRLQAAQKLGDACDKRAITPLIDRLRDPELQIRLAAIEALGKLVRLVIGQGPVTRLSGQPELHVMWLDIGRHEIAQAGNVGLSLLRGVGRLGRDAQSERAKKRRNDQVPVHAEAFPIFVPSF